MGKTALGLSDLFHHTGRQHGLVGHVKEAVFNRGRAGVYNQDLHVIFFRRIKV
jgi:hypothetical protein